MRSIRLKFGYALPSASSCYLGKARKRSLLSERYSVPPRRSAICKLRLHCARWQRRFSGSLCEQREQSPQTKRAPPKEGNRQNALARFDKISPGARIKSWAEQIKRYAVSLRPAGVTRTPPAQGSFRRVKARPRATAEVGNHSNACFAFE